MILAFVVYGLSQLMFILYLVFMFTSSSPSTYYSSWFFGLAMLAMVVDLASLFLGIGNLRAPRKKRGVISIVFSAVAVTLIMTIIVIEYIHRTGVPLF